eukprot:TRINITY_DN4523_c0_g1_i10.p1 TRINITY_DN4523_c0_g1~~TRINITY_DN4523_c0_g1_i10.p1  ORF type:complete len:350 (+),score=74.36 TRINITY_DN4523_c0_g1_i10:113-1051(+)
MSRSCTSGAAAAVAIGVIDAAITTECSPILTKNTAKTATVGMKLSHDAAPEYLTDVPVVSHEVDSIGIVTRTAEDLKAFFEETFPDKITPEPQGELRVAFMTDWGGYSDVSRWEIGVAGDRLKGKCGTYVVDHGLFDALQEFKKNLGCIVMGDFDVNKEELGVADDPRVIEYIKPTVEYRDDAYHFRKRWRYFMGRYLTDIKVSAILTPTTPHDAPTPSNHASNSEFSAPFILSGSPTITLPLHLTSPLGIPLSVQLIGTVDRDYDLILAATKVEELLKQNDSDTVPPLWEREPLQILENAAGNKGLKGGGA